MKYNWFLDSFLGPFCVGLVFTIVFCAITIPILRSIGFIVTENAPCR